MTRTSKLLSHGLFEKPFMDSRVQSRTLSKKEEILGHLVGPLGLIFVVNTIAALVEKFFTQQTGAIYGVENLEMVRVMGHQYEVVMTFTKILAVAWGLFVGWLIQHTQSRQGRFRPWHLIFGFITIAIGCLIFLFPGNDLGGSYWYYFFFLIVCYNTVGSSFFYLFRSNICSLTTRDPREKTQVQFIRQMSWTLLSGVVIGMVINMVLLPMWLEKDINGYPILMLCLSIAAIPLLLLEYFYTRERITEDMAVEVGLARENSVPLLDQMRALLDAGPALQQVLRYFNGAGHLYRHRGQLQGRQCPVFLCEIPAGRGRGPHDVHHLPNCNRYSPGVGGYLCLPRCTENRHPQLYLSWIYLHFGRKCFGAAVPLQPAHCHHSRVPAPGRSDPQQLRVRYPVVLCL